MVVKGPGPLDEAFHAEVSVEEEVVWRWGVDNGTEVERQVIHTSMAAMIHSPTQGESGDGTSIDYEEPVVLT